MLKADNAGTIATVIPYDNGYAIHGWDNDARIWKRLGAAYRKDYARNWIAWVPDLTMLIACAKAHGPIQAHAEVMRHLALRETAIAASSAPSSDAIIPAPEGLEYLPFQRAGIEYARRRKSVLIADEMGLGKTIQALGLVNAVGDVRSILILCPASLKLNWLREARKWLLHPSTWCAWVANGDPCPSWSNLAICNYDRIGKHSELSYREWDLVIADEAHYLKNPKADRTELTMALLAKCKRKVFLTGTPIMNRTKELWTLVSKLAPRSFSNEKAFKERYCRKDDDTHLEELNEKLRASLMLRRLKSQVLKDLPAKQRQIIELEPLTAAEKHAVENELNVFESGEQTTKQAEAAVEAAKACGAESYRQAVERLRQSRMMALAELAKVRHETARIKIPQTVRHVRQLIAGGAAKLLVFYHHQVVGDSLIEEFEDLDPILIDGSVDPMHRQPLVDKFQKDPACQVALLSIQAAGVGLTLTAANTEVFHELDWNPAVLAQAEDRAHRIGQLDSVLVQHLVYDGSLDARMAKMIIAKQDLADKALGRAA